MDRLVPMEYGVTRMLMLQRAIPSVKVDISIELLAKLREYLREPRSRAELQKFCEIKSRDHFRNKILIPLIDSKKIKLTIPDKPTSSKQKYVWNDN